MYDYNCRKCGGLVAEPMKMYGYSGQFCHCKEPQKPDTTTTATALGQQMTYIQSCTCGQKCPIHGINNLTS